MLNWLRSVFGAGSRASDDANTQMLDQFYGTLQAILHGIDVSNAPEEIRAVYAATKEILEYRAVGPGTDQRSWNSAYKAEKMLARLRPVASLRYELQTQIAYLSSMQHETAQDYRNQFLALFPHPPERVDPPGAAPGAAGRGPDEARGPRAVETGTNAGA
jgi:hypothetical protein